MLEELASQAFWIGLLKIIGVNIILSGDNAVVIALAARSLPAKQQTQAVFWGAGLAISIPLVVFGATLLIKLMERFPVIITGGAGLIGWVAGEMLVADLALKGWFTSLGVQYKDDHPLVGGYELEWIAAAVGFVIVVALGKWLAKRKEAAAPQTPADVPK